MLGLALMSALFVVTADPAPAAADGCRVAVLTPTLHNVGGDAAWIEPLVVDALADEIARASTCEVITEADIASMVAFEGQKQALGCSEDAPSCLSELGDALGVERVVSGSLTRADDQLALSVRLVDVAEVRIVARAQVFAEVTPAALKRASGQAASALFGQGPPPDTSDAGPSVLAPTLLWGGVGALGVGAILAVVGLGGGGAAYALAIDATSPYGNLRPIALSAWLPLVVTGAVGAALVVVGGVAAASSFAIE